jgi:hypothetical protein
MESAVVIRLDFRHNKNSELSLQFGHDFLQEISVSTIEFDYDEMIAFVSLFHGLFSSFSSFSLSRANMPKRLSRSRKSTSR